MVSKIVSSILLVYLMSCAPAKSPDHGSGDTSPQKQTPTSIGGIPSGNEGAYGGDPINDQDSAWFLGAKKTIRGCLNIDKQAMGLAESVSDESIRALIQATFQKWLAYIAVKQIESPSEVPELSYAKLLQLDAGLNHCSYSNGVDIIFNFGVPLAEKQQQLLGEHQNAAAVAVRLSNNDIGWQHGFISLAPVREYSFKDEAKALTLHWYDPNAKNPLRAMEVALLHEWGHVFGNPHVEGTIMERNILRRILRLAPDTSTEVTIDEGRELAVCYHCNRERFENLNFNKELLKRFLTEISKDVGTNNVIHSDGNLLKAHLRIERPGSAVIPANPLFVLTLQDLLGQALQYWPIYSLEMESMTHALQSYRFSTVPIQFNQDFKLFVRSFGNVNSAFRAQKVYPAYSETCSLRSRVDHRELLVLQRNTDAEYRIKINPSDSPGVLFAK